jgi:hypothetical protein
MDRNATAVIEKKGKEMTDITLERMYRKLATDEITLAMITAKEILEAMNQDDKILGRVDRQQQIAVATMILQQINFHRRWDGE